LRSRSGRCRPARAMRIDAGARYSAVPCSARTDLVIREFAFLVGTGPQLIDQLTWGADVRDIDGWSARVKRGGEPPRPTGVGVVVVHAAARDS
jgi:hypothetical protein